MCDENRIKELKMEYDEPRFRYQDTHSIPNYKEIVDKKTGDHYNVQEIEEVLEILNKMNKEALLYPLFVEWLLVKKRIYKGVSTEFEDELEYENKYVKLIANEVHSKKQARRIYNSLKEYLIEPNEERVL